MNIVYNDIEEDDEDEEDYWDEEYEDKFDGALQHIDELAAFKETMALIETNSPEYYQQLLSVVSNHTLTRISGFLDRVLMYTAQKR